jgi:nucleotide-binding universal stress UspA family protein
MAYKTIICGVTGSEASQKAALGAALLAKENQAKLIFVYSVDTAFLKGMTVELSAQFAQQSLSHLGEHILEHAEQIALGQGVASHKFLRKGPLLEVLKKVTIEEKGDLLVLGQEPRSFFDKVLFRGRVEDHLQELRRQMGIEAVIVQ